MRLEFHPAVRADFDAAVNHYLAAGGPHLADRFEAEIHACLVAIKTSPTRFPFYLGNDRLRRIRLKNFPYLLVYRLHAAVVRVSVLKHERRHPRFGMDRH